MDNENITSGVPPQTIEPIVSPAKSKFSILLIILVIFLFFVIGIGAYYFGTQQTTIKTNIIPTQNPTPTTISYPTQTITVADEFKIPLKENWKRITIANLGFSMQIPNEWKAGYCRNKLKKEFTTIEFTEGDNLFLASDSAEFDYPDCATDYVSMNIRKAILFSTKKNIEDFINFVNPKGRLPRKMEFLTINGLNFRFLHIDWCEGLMEGEFTLDPNGCIPIVGGKPIFVLVEIPKDKKLTNYDFLEFNFIFSNEIPNEILKTIEF